MVYWFSGEIEESAALGSQWTLLYQVHQTNNLILAKARLHSYDSKFASSWGSNLYVLKNLKEQDNTVPKQTFLSINHFQGQGEALVDVIDFLSRVSSLRIYSPLWLLRLSFQRQ